MMQDILTAVFGTNHRRSRFPAPPAGTYAVWTDDVEVDGPDYPDDAAPMIYRHAVTVEVYEPRPDDAAEAALEAVLRRYGMKWHKQDRYWIKTEQLYQTIYEFEYIEKRRN